MDEETSKAFVTESVNIEDGQISYIDTNGDSHSNVNSPLLNSITRTVTVLSDAQAQQAFDFVLQSNNVPQARTALNQIIAATTVGTNWENFNKNILNGLNETKAKELYDSLMESTEKSDSQKEKSKTVKKEGKVEGELPSHVKELAEAVAKKLGVDITSFTADNGDRGQYNPDTGEISLNTTNQDEAIMTIFHEAIGEVSQRYNAKGMKVIQNEILDYLKETLGTAEFNSLVQAYQNAYRQSDSKVDQNKTRREAANEMVNDTLWTLFASEEGMKDFTDWVNDNHTATESVSILTKVKDFIDKILDYIKNLMSTVKLNSSEKAMLDMSEERMRGLRKQVLEVLDEAIANRDAAVGNSENRESAPKNSKEIIDSKYTDAVDDNIIKLFDKVNNGKSTKRDYVTLNDVISDRFAADVYNNIHVDVTGYKNEIGQSGIKHIIKDHGANGRADHSMADPKDIARIKYVLDNYDQMRPGKLSKEYRNKDHSLGKTVEIQKKLGDKYYYVVEVAQDTDAHIMRVISAYINKKDTFSELAVSNDPSRYVQDEIQSNASFVNSSLTPEEQNASTTSSRKSISVDTNGRELSEGQKEYFADSKVVDEDGKLNLNPTEDSDIRFSLKVPVEETKDLIAMHNISKNKLLKTIELGGFPMPSIGITKADQGYEDFGDISVIFNKDTIDPANSKNRVYSGDAWTPTFPTIEYKVNEDALRDIAKRVGQSYSYLEANIFDGSSNTRTNLYNAKYIKETFLKENNIEKQPKHLGYEEVKPNPRYIVQSPSAEVYILSNDITYDKLIATPGLETEIANEIRSDAEKRNPMAQRTLKLKAQNFERAVEDIRNKSGDYLDREAQIKTDFAVIRGEETETYQKDLGYTDGIDEAIQAHEAEYNKFVDDIMSSVVGKYGVVNHKDIYDRAGNRRSFEYTHYEYSLEGLVKAMLEEDEQGAGTFMAGWGNMTGLATERLNSIDEIKAERDRIQNLSEDEIKAIKQNLLDRFAEIINALNTTPEDFFANDNIATSIGEALRESRTRTGFKNALLKYNVKKDAVTDALVSDIFDLLHDIRVMPTKYLEAKPRRAVGLDEIAGVVVPSDSQNVKEALESNNIPYAEYQPGDDESRIKALNSFENARFSKKVTLSDSREVDNLADVLTPTEYNRLKEMIGSGYPAFNSSDGDAVYRLDNKLVYARGKENFGISRIVEANVYNDADVTSILDWFTDAALLEEWEYDEQRTVIEGYYGQEAIKEYTNADFGKTSRFDRPTKRGKSRSDAYYAQREQNRRRVYIKDGKTIGEDIRNSIKVDWDTHNSYEVPARTYDDTVGFFGTDEEIEAMEQQDLAVKSYYANIIHSKGFKGFMFEFKDGSRVKQNYLTRSTRKGYDWQYSYGYDNEPHGHNNYKDVNDIVEVYGNVWGDDMQALYQELLDATPADKISTSKRRIICRT